MTANDLIQRVEQLDRAERLRLIALAAGYQAHADGDGGIQTAQALDRIAARLRCDPR